MKLEFIKESFTGNLWVNGRLQAIRKVFSIRDAVILEIGSGGGNYVAAMYQENNRVIYSDVEDAPLAAVPGAKLCLDAQRLPVKNESLDGIICADVLEHVPADAEAVREFHRALKPGGRLLLTLPAYSRLYSEHQIKIGHLRRYDRMTAVSLLHRAGFRVDALRYSGFWLLVMMTVIQGLGWDETRFHGRTSGPRGRARGRSMMGRVLLRCLVAVDGIFNGWCGISMIIAATKAGEKKV